MPPIELTGDGVKLRALQRRLKEAGERGLTRELNKGLKAAVEPIAAAERQAAQGLPSAKDAGAHGLRAALANSIRIRMSSSKSNPGASVYIPRGTIPGWKNPGKDTSKAGGWRHRVYGGKTWVRQVSEPGWWPRTARTQSPQAKAKIRAAVEAVNRKVARG